MRVFIKKTTFTDTLSVVWFCMYSYSWIKYEYAQNSVHVIKPVQYNYTGGHFAHEMG